MLYASRRPDLETVINAGVWFYHVYGLFYGADFKNIGQDDCLRRRCSAYHILRSIAWLIHLPSLQDYILNWNGVEAMVRGTNSYVSTYLAWHMLPRSTILKLNSPPYINNKPSNHSPSMDNRLDSSRMLGHSRTSVSTELDMKSLPTNSGLSKLVKWLSSSSHK